MRIERLGALGEAPEVLRSVEAATARLGLPPPAALTGEWFSSRAVIAPSVTMAPVDPAVAFDVRPGSKTGSDADVVGGGWIGYVSYPDAGYDRANPRIPEAAGGWTDCVLHCDRHGMWWYESLTGAGMPTWLREACRTRTDPSPWHIDWVTGDRAHHRMAVLACLAAIRDGEVYQACVCTRFTGFVTGAPVDFFADSVTRNAPARAAYLRGEWGAVASLSPELFLRRCGEVVISSPIKGTLPLASSPQALLASAKDVAENIMIVDLVRNDLGRIAATGSITVPELLAIRPAPGVWHLVSTVAARVPVETPAAALLNATFPPASVTGTPKFRARQMISQWEPHRRGIYCGTIGMASPVAGCELNVAIRTVEFDRSGGAILGVGGGITADSDVDTEWQECLHKAAPILAPDRAPDQSRPHSRPRSTAS